MPALIARMTWGSTDSTTASRGAVPTSGEFGSVPFAMTPQPMRPPEPPIGWAMWSSGFSWMMTAEPSPSRSAGMPPPATETRVMKNSARAEPSAAAYRLGRSPLSGPSGWRRPCLAISGLMCPPAAVKSGAQAPTACRWMPWPPGGRPVTSTDISTPVGVCSKVASPMTLPSVSTISAVAVPAAEATGATAFRRAVPTSGEPGSVPFAMTPQPMRPPEPPIGWAMWSSGFSWMMTAEPSPSRSAGMPPPATETRVMKNSARAEPSAAAYRLGRSPLSGPSGWRRPCLAISGLMCPPAAVKSGAQAPTACRWMPWPPGGRPVTSTDISTPVGVCSKVASPMTSPSVSTISAVAVSAAEATGAATRARTAASAMPVIFIRTSCSVRTPFTVPAGPPGPPRERCGAHRRWQRTP